MDYTNELSTLLTKPYHQWIDGSFVSTKATPQDIDLITVVHYQDYEEQAIEIGSRFSGSKARELYQVDAYIVADYLESHRKFVFAKSDKLYWISLFSKTRVNRAKRQHDKGLIQLNFKSIDDFVIDQEQARVLDILEQIKKLNQMITMHKTESNDSVMANQYRDMKYQFLTELKEVLSEYEVEVVLKNHAA